MKLTDGEKLILIMLSEMYEKLGLDGEIDPKFVRSAIFSGNLWGFDWKYSGIPFEESETPQIVSEVADILDMWFFVERSYQELNDIDKMKVEKEAEPFGKNPSFRGFDGNNEAEHINVARFLIDDLERFQEFRGRELNSHMPSIGSQMRMLRAFKPMREQLSRDFLNADQIIELLKEKIDPDRR